MTKQKIKTRPIVNALNERFGVIRKHPLVEEAKFSVHRWGIQVIIEYFVGDRLFRSSFCMDWKQFSGRVDILKIMLEGTLMDILKQFNDFYLERIK